LTNLRKIFNYRLTLYISFDSELKHVPVCLDFDKQNEDTDLSNVKEYLLKRISQLESEVGKAKEKYTESQIAMNLMSEELQQCKQEKSQAIDSQRKFKASLEQAETELERKSIEIKAAQKEAAKAKQELQDTKQKLEASLEQVENQLELKTKEVKDTKRKAEMIKQEAATTKQELKVSKGVVSSPIPQISNFLPFIKQPTITKIQQFPATPYKHTHIFILIMLLNI
jgi:chromosome segregation ATPase